MQMKLNKNSTYKKYTTLRDVENVQELTNAFNQCGHLLQTTTLRQHYLAIYHPPSPVNTFRFRVLIFRIVQSLELSLPDKQY